MSVTFKTLRYMTLVGLILFYYALVNCKEETPPRPGGDRPLTTQRLTGATLTDIHDDSLRWSFDETAVVIDSGGEPIPSDLIQELLGHESMHARIEADWSLDENKGFLHLSELKADGEAVDTGATLAIEPAGRIRINLGSRQYNLAP